MGTNSMGQGRAMTEGGMANNTIIKASESMQNDFNNIFKGRNSVLTGGRMANNTNHIGNTNL